TFLIDIGINGCSVEDSSDFLDFLQNKSSNWDYIDESLMALKNIRSSVTAYLQDNEQGHMQFKLITESYPDFESESVSDQDWANNWKKYFKPIEIGSRLAIKPSWEEYDNKDNRKIVTLDPGNSFGTGTHETTRLCLEQCERLVNESCRVLDAGCGSGILGISALTLGAYDCTFFDIDQSSIETTISNSVINRVEDRALAICTNIFEDKKTYSMLINRGPYDIVFANIVPDVINAMLPFLNNATAEDGCLICSGIIEEREDEVRRNMIINGFSYINSEKLNGWVVLIGRR
ncbi:MAG: 50S ribosomal protein L11 methyltransferase, partial [Clostridia bacterium]